MVVLGGGVFLVSEVPLYGGRFSGPGSYFKGELNQSLSGSEVYFTHSVILLVKNLLCSKLHCQKDFNSILSLYKILRGCAP